MTSIQSTEVQSVASVVIKFIIKIVINIGRINRGILISLCFSLLLGHTSEGILVWLIAGLVLIHNTRAAFHSTTRESPWANIFGSTHKEG